MRYAIQLIILLWPLWLNGQPSLRQRRLQGQFLTDSIEIGRPFQYALTYHHAAANDVLFPDTTRSFAPYRVQSVAVFATQTTDTGPRAISTDSAVYTLVSFETSPVQRLRVPILIIHDVDCTAQWTLADSVFLRSKLPLALLDSAQSDSIQRLIPKLATETDLVPLRQQFNYWALAIGFAVGGLVAFTIYRLFGQIIRQRWLLYQLKRSHLRFLGEFNRLSRRINAHTVAENANQAVIMWKTYLESIDPQPYTSLTTPELATRINDERITNALREADRMIYGGTFSPESLPALRLLGEVATHTYHQVQARLQNTPDRAVPAKNSSIERSSAA